MLDPGLAEVVRAQHRVTGTHGNGPSAVAIECDSVEPRRRTEVALAPRLSCIIGRENDAAGTNGNGASCVAIQHDGSVLRKEAGAALEPRTPAVARREHGAAFAHGNGQSAIGIERDSVKTRGKSRSFAPVQVTPASSEVSVVPSEPTAIARAVLASSTTDQR